MRLVTENIDPDKVEDKEDISLITLFTMFSAALIGIFLAGEFIIVSATTIALPLHIPESVIALTLVAFGTSIPEIATCIVAARKKEGAIAVGNILGADIMNVCWVASASAMANDLTLGKKEIFFMFPWMFIIVGLMLIMMKNGYRLTKLKGAILFGSYVFYVITLFIFFPPSLS